MISRSLPKRFQPIFINKVHELVYTLFLTDFVGLNFSTARDLISNRPYLSQFEEFVDDLGTDRKISHSSFDRYHDRRPTPQTKKDTDGSR